MTPNEQSTEEPCAELVKKLRREAADLITYLANHDLAALLRAAADRLERQQKDTERMDWLAANGHAMDVVKDGKAEKVRAIHFGFMTEINDARLAIDLVRGATTNHAVDHTISSAEGGTKEGSRE